jgi:hypothetical protein
MPRDAFPGYGEPVNIDMEPEEAIRLLTSPEEPNNAEVDAEDTE